MMFNKVLLLPFIIDNMRVAIDTMLDEGALPTRLGLDLTDELSFPAPVAPGNIKVCATLVGVKVDETAAAIRISGKDDYLSDPMVIAAMGTNHLYVRRWRIGGILIELAVGISRERSFSSFNPVYRVTMTDFVRDAQIYYARVEYCDLTDGEIPHEKQRYTDNLTFSLERLSKSTGHAILYSGV